MADLAAALAATDDRRVRFEPGSDAARAAADRFMALFADFTPEGVRARGAATYHDDAWFDDTLKTVEGGERIVAHLLASAEACDRCTVDLDDVMVGADGELYLRWTMRMDLKKVKRGTTLESIGVTHLRIDREDGRILLHQDYWDGARGFFEHVPLLGRAIRWIKGRI